MDDIVFVAYPSNPPQIGHTISSAIEDLRSENFRPVLQSWEQLDIPGRFILDGILEKIDSSAFVVADITRLNFNVTFEVGYAIGRGKRIVLTVNESLKSQTRELVELGIFDTLGFTLYENSQGLADIIRGIIDHNPLNFPATEIDKSAPVYILETRHKSDATVRITSKIKKARINYRSFDPKEQPRLTTLEAYRGVKKSIAIVVNLLSSEANDSFFNNLRGAFLAGLSFGLDKDTLVFQEGEEPVPLDYRDLVTIYRHPHDVDQPLNELAPRVTEGLQTAVGYRSERDRGFLARLDLGSPAAENEIDTLGEYYVTTDEFSQVRSGKARLAVGRKGSGKSALFFQVRDTLRTNRSRIIIDLRPEGHQLVRFKSLVLDLLQDTVQDHVVSAFWEYIILLEISYKILEKDRQTHLRNHHITELYRNLKEVYSPELLAEEIDFSERMLMLVNNISDKFLEKHSGDKPVYLTSAQVTELIYSHDIRQMHEILAEYLEHKNGVYILIDNLDKGWPTHGVQAPDILILRYLMEATRKLERYFRSRSVAFHTTVFVRNDVYELLIDESPDRGKESKVSLDWTDPDLLYEFIRRRLVYNDLEEETSFQEAWSKICASHIEGEYSAEYLLDRSLMRPRNFLTLVNHCKSIAVNLQHDTIQADDIKKACSAYSADVCNEIGYEIRDVFPEAEDVLYEFIGAPSPLPLSSIKAILGKANVQSETTKEILIEVLIWFAFLGVKNPNKGNEKDIFIYDVHYDMKKLRHLAGNLAEEERLFVIQKAFWPFLEINT